MHSDSPSKPQSLQTSATTVSVVIPVRSLAEAPSCLSSLSKSKYPSELVEVILAEGDNPSRQRNLGVKASRGEILYFLDDDSLLDPRAINTLVQAFEDRPEVAVVGGPSVGYAEGSCFQKSAAMAMGSLFGFGPLRHRYYPSGCPRAAGENELILSNLAIRRKVWERTKGFDVRLYPNEENEFLRRLEAEGESFVYHPGVLVFRPARSSLVEVSVQTARYGCGRAEHMRLRAHPLNVTLLCPVLFVSYLIGLLTLGYFVALPEALKLLMLFPLSLYLLLTCLASIYAGLAAKKGAQTFFWHLLIYPTIHLSYGCGMLFGLIGRTARPVGKRPVTLWQVKTLQQIELDTSTPWSPAEGGPVCA